MAFNVLAAKRAGYTDAEIADYLAQQSNFDAAGARQSGYKDDEIVSHLNRQGFSFGEAFMAGARAEAWSELAGVKQMLGGDLSDEQVAQENLARQAFEERGFAAGLGMLAGGLLNPSTLLPGSMLLKGAKGVAAAGALAGGVSGAVRPVYTEEDMGRVTSAAVGAGLGGALGFGLGKLIDQFGAKAAEDIVNTGTLSPDGTEIKTPHYKLKLKEDGSWERTEIEPSDELLRAREDALERRAATADTPQPVVEEPVAAAARQIEEEALPVLPQFLSGAAPRFAKSTIDFETDIDKALYIVGNPVTKSARHDDYMAFLRQALQKSDQEISQIAGQVRKEVVQAGKVAQAEAGLSGVKEVPNFKFNFSSALDSTINPVNKYLDETSKMVYNIGAGYRLNSKGYSVLSPKQAEEAVTLMQRVDPTFLRSKPDATRNVSAYRRYLDDMKKLRGRQFKPPSFEDFIKNGIRADDQIKMVEAGFFDGCL